MKEILGRLYREVTEAGQDTLDPDAATIVATQTPDFCGLRGLVTSTTLSMGISLKLYRVANSLGYEQESPNS